jgi:hypothetical protein
MNERSMVDTKRTTKKLDVGAIVRFRFGVTDVTADVIEDRGPLGTGGERIYRVRLHFTDVAEPLETEIEAGRLTLVEPAA